MSDDSRRVKELFVAALELAKPDDRAAFLDRECASNPNLRHRLEVLLQAHDHPDSAVDRPLIAKSAESRTGTYAPDTPPTATFGDPEATADHTPQPDTGTVIGGKYKLVEEIGEGGMGTVWVALQIEPVRRTVAVKLIKAGMDSKAVLARFEAERQALAIMDHPNIARVLDGGATPDGRPFFVMELVKGVPITQFCDERKLTPRQRLELFIPVCQAIQHAHQKGVIHRDIKPNNVLIALYDDRAVPKVIDFGIAKATGQTLTNKTLMTGFGAVVGTPEYMSPEQASLNNLDIDTRSDVYSLGVLLYELLTGTTPVDRKSLGQAAILEVLRIVREVEAPRPSARLSSLATLPSIAANRGTEPAKLSRLLRRELDWVVLKAMEKDRARRYESANGFASDVQRYLEGEAVQAHPPSTVYRLRKFARKYRAVLSMAAAFIVLLLASVAISSWLAVKANRASVEAEDNAKQANHNARLVSEKFAEAEYARREVQFAARSLQVDLDLAEVKTDPRVGVLRLAATLKSLTADQSSNNVFDVQDVIKITLEPNTALLAKQRELREFISTVLLAGGQNYAPLLPPVTHDGQEVLTATISPDGKTLLTLGVDGTARLWDSRTANPIAILRQRNERVAGCGFSPDGRTIFTDDEQAVARLWDAPSGKFRASTERSPNGNRLIDNTYRNVQISDNRLLTRVICNNGSPFGTQTLKSEVDLWNTTTGRLIARLDRSLNPPTSEYVFLGGGRWIAALGNFTVSVFSSVDGRLVSQLSHPYDESNYVRSVDASPTGRWLATVCNHDTDTPFNPVNPREESVLRLWDTAAWSTNPVRIPIEGFNYFCRFLTDDLFAIDDGKSIRCFRRCGDKEPITLDDLCQYNYLGNGDNLRPHLVRDELRSTDGRIFNLREQQPVRSPIGRKFHPDLQLFAPDGRFAYAFDTDSLVYTLIDTLTEKEFRNTGELRYVQNFGWVGGVQGMKKDVRLADKRWAKYGAEIRLIPSPTPELPPYLLEFWVQVAVRGELGQNGNFSKWDEQTWERKRKELETASVPNSNIPFPGYLATDKLHWLRAEYLEPKTGAEKPELRLVTELLRRSKLNEDRNEAIRWKVELSKLTPEEGPPPREVK